MSGMTRREDEAVRQYVQQVLLFRGLAPRELDQVAQAARRRQMTRGASFFEQDDPATTLFILVQGRIKLLQFTPEGHQVVMHLVGPGEVFGMIAATLGEARYPATAQAVEDCTALLWERQTMVDLMERYPRLALNALQFVAARVHEFQDRYRELATERVERRVARALLRLVSQAGRREPEGGVLIDMPLSRRDLAEMTGTTLFTVSRLLSRWEQQNIVESSRERVRVLALHALVTIAEDLPTGP
jgi:CRP-like cAMP-binding protein